MCQESAYVPNEFDSRVDRFDTMWHSGSVPEIADFLSPSGSSNLGASERRRLLVELVMIDLEFRWRSCTGASANRSQPAEVEQLKRPYLRDYLDRYPELGPLDELPTELIANEYRVRQRWGDQPSHGDYLEKFPAQAHKLKDALRQIDDELPTTPSNALSVRCPHCNSTINLTDDTTVTDAHCHTCGSNFSLLPGGQDIENDANSLTIGHFDLLEKLGSGTFGTVWKARDRELDRIVTVKIPHRTELDDTQAEQILREARVVAQLNHPNIVSVFEVGRERETVFIVSDYVVGDSLSNWLKEQRPSFSEIARLCMKMAEALHHAHQAGVVHRDLKPDNVLVDRHGEPRLTDFGLARRQTGEVTMTANGQILGTLAYMSPEQAQGHSHQADSRSDIYSLGVILFQMLTEDLPFRGNVHMLMHQIIHDDVPQPRRLNGHVPRDLETICLKCLQKAPRNRYGSAQELAEELQRFLLGEAIHTRPIGPIGRSWRWCKRHPAVSSLTAGLLVVLLSGLAGVTSQWMRADQERRNAGQQRDTANRHLYQALVGQARAIRLARNSGYRREVFNVLTQALAVDTPARDVDEIRQEAVACMGDFVGLEPTIWKNLPCDIGRIAARPQTAELAIGLTNGTVLLRDLASGEEIARLSGHSSRIRALKFNSAGNLLVSCDADGHVRLWEADARTMWSCTKTFVTRGGIDAVAISPNRERLLVSLDSGSRVITYSIEDESENPTSVELPIRSGTVRLGRSSFTLDGKLLVTVTSSDGVLNLWVWDVAKGEILKALQPDLGHAIFGVVFSRNGRLLVCNGTDGVAVFDRSEQWAKTRLLGDMGSVALSANNELLATVSQQLGVIRLWNISAHREVAVLADLEKTAVPAVVFSGDSQFLVVGGPRVIRFWILTTDGEKHTPAGHIGGVPGLAFNPAGTRLASAGKDHTVKLWDPRTGDLLHTLGDFRGPAQTVAFSPDGLVLATGDWSGAVEMWDSQTGRRLSKVDHQVGEKIWTVAFSPNGQHFAVSGNEGATIWRIQRDPRIDDVSPRMVVQKPIQLTTSEVDFGVFSPNSKLYAWVDRGQSPRIGHVWDLEEEKELFGPPLKLAGEVYAANFYPNSRLLTFVGIEGAVEVWDVNARKRTLCYATPEQMAQDGVSLHGHLSLSRDGHWTALDVVADTGQALTIWDTEQQEMLLRFPEERGAIWAVALSPDRKVLAVGTSSGGPVIWNIPRIRSQLGELGLDW